MIKKILTAKNVPEQIKDKTLKIVSLNYMPLALSQSYKFIYKNKIPKYLIKEYNSIAVLGLVKGINKYNWNTTNSNLANYLTKYINYEMNHNINKNKIIFDSERLEWQIYKFKNNDYQYYYKKMREYILGATDYLMPFERRLFFIVYDVETLEKTDKTINQICELAGIDNDETYRLLMIKIMDKIKKYDETNGNPYNLFYNLDFKE